MQLFLFCYFVLFSLVNTKSTPPPPGVDGADEEDDDGYDHWSGPPLEACNIGPGEQRGMLDVINDDKVIDEVINNWTLVRSVAQTCCMSFVKSLRFF